MTGLTEPQTMRLLIEAMVKHLPPSASRLRLLDVDGVSGEVLAALRDDLDVISTAPLDSVDAITAYDHAVDDAFLSEALSMLRPGGRLVVVNASAPMSEKWGRILEAAGYTRILVEPVLSGVLMRGEKPHTEQRTQDRIQQVAERDSDLLDLSTYTGRYIHLLVRQTPNKPVWKLAPDEHIEWQAVAVAGASLPTLLAFSSLPKAVALMQPAVMAGHIKDVNKVARFNRDVAQTWALPVLLNPKMDTLEGRRVMFVPVDPQTAETPDE